MDIASKTSLAWLRTQRQPAPRLWQRPAISTVAFAPAPATNLPAQTLGTSETNASLAPKTTSGAIDSKAQAALIATLLG